jgi:hypothetical protein
MPVGMMLSKLSPPNRRCTVASCSPRKAEWPNTLRSTSVSAPSLGSASTAACRSAGSGSSGCSVIGG